MQQRSKFIQRTSALALAAVLALGMGVQAAGPSTSTVDDRREDLTIFYETLKDSHPDLFANTPEETFLARKAELTEHLDTASDVEFLFGLQSLAALVGDFPHQRPGGGQRGGPAECLSHGAVLAGRALVPDHSSG